MTRGYLFNMFISHMSAKHKVHESAILSLTNKSSSDMSGISRGNSLHVIKHSNDVYPLSILCA